MSGRMTSLLATLSLHKGRSAAHLDRIYNSHALSADRCVGIVGGLHVQDSAVCGLGTSTSETTVSTDGRCQDSLPKVKNEER
jgi:hypothetical protein